MMWFRPLTQTLAVETTPANVVVAVFEFVDDDDDVAVVVYVGEKVTEFFATQPVLIK